MPLPAAGKMYMLRQQIWHSWRRRQLFARRWTLCARNDEWTTCLGVYWMYSFSLRYWHMVLVVLATQKSML